MSSIEWMCLWTLNGLEPIHAAAERVLGRQVWQIDGVVLTEKQRAQKERRYELQAAYRARRRLSAAERVDNMMTAVRGEA